MRLRKRGSAVVVALSMALTTLAAANPTSTPAASARLAGPTRIDTAVAVSQQLYADGQAGGAVLARADVLADALTGVPLATALDGPLLLTDSDELDPAVLAELRRALRPGARVVLTGGLSALTAEVAEDVRDAGFRVDRLAGSDRVETSLAIAEDLTHIAGRPQRVMVVSGPSQADAPSASAVAARHGWPVILSAPNAVSPSSHSVLAQADEAVLVGGVGVLGTHAEKSIASVVTTRRIAGTDRYETSHRVVRQFAGDARSVVIVNGEALSDALVASTYAAATDAALLLVGPTDDMSGVTEQLLTELGADRVTAVGGVRRISDRLLATAAEAAGRGRPARQGDESKGTPSPDEEDAAPTPDPTPTSSPTTDPTPTPSPTTAPAPDPSGSVVAGPDTTGVTDEARLRPAGSVSSSRDGQVIENLDVTGSIKVQHSNVTIRNVRVRATGLFGIYVPSSLGDRVTGLLIEDTEIAGVSGDRAAGLAEYGRWTARRIDVHGFQDGVKMSSGQVLEASWIHDLYKADGSHNDGIQSAAGRDGVIRNNTIEGPYRSSTSAILLQTDFGAIDNWVIEGNRISGGTYTMYLRDKKHGAPTNMTIRDNVWMDASWKYGAYSGIPAAATTWRGNTFDDGSTFVP